MSREEIISKSSNDASLEEMWAKKAIMYASVYDELLYKTDIAKLKLTSIDDEIYAHFRGSFPDLNVEVFDYDASKTEQGKEQWRAFMNAYAEEKLKDFNMATLMRTNGLEEFSQENSCIVLRAQFFAIEIARNREGVNAKYQEKVKKAE